MYCVILNVSQWSIYQYKASNTQWSKTVSKEGEYELPLKFSFCQPSVKNNVGRDRRFKCCYFGVFFCRQERGEVGIWERCEVSEVTKWESGKVVRSRDGKGNGV